MSVDHLFGQNTRQSSVAEDDQWMSVSDLMSGLMMVFVFIAIAMMRDAFVERDKIKEVAVTYHENQGQLYQRLMTEFAEDLAKWDATIHQDTLAFDFRSPDVLFDSGRTAIKLKFQHILADFLPRYVRVLSDFRQSVSEIRIEGHTSSDWGLAVSPEQAYFNNMRLSQGRTRAVLQYMYDLPTLHTERPWMKKHIAAVGLSSSKAVLTAYGLEDKARSRRVSFRVITNAETQIRKILEVS
jgi:outer membrane protein OmpA-like peptidoglycan-associated protein